MLHPVSGQLDTSLAANTHQQPHAHNTVNQKRTPPRKGEAAAYYVQRASEVLGLIVPPPPQNDAGPTPSSEPAPLPDFVPDVRDYLRTRRDEERRTARATSTQRLKTLLTARDWTNPEREAQAAQEAGWQLQPDELEAALSQAQQPVMPDVVRIDKLARYANAESVRLGIQLSKGAIRLFDLVHGVAVRIAASRGYSPAVTQVVYALPQQVIAAALGYTDRHVRRLQAELEAAGLLVASAYASSVEGQNLWATMLWAVKTTTANTTPRIHADYWTHEWRNLEQDAKRGNTVMGKMSELKDLNRVDVVGQLYQMVVTGLFKLSPVTPSFSSDIRLGAVSDAVDGLSILGEVAPSERRNLIRQLAGWLSTSLNDSHSYKWWCGLLWSVAGSWEAVGALQAKLSRLLADLSEWDGIRTPAAWFAARVNNWAVTAC